HRPVLADKPIIPFQAMSAPAGSPSRSRNRAGVASIPGGRVSSSPLPPGFTHHTGGRGEDGDAVPVQARSGVLAVRGCSPMLFRSPSSLRSLPHGQPPVPQPRPPLPRLARPAARTPVQARFPRHPHQHGLRRDLRPAHLDGHRTVWRNPPRLAQDLPPLAPLHPRPRHLPFPPLPPP